MGTAVAAPIKEINFSPKLNLRFCIIITFSGSYIKKKGTQTKGFYLVLFRSKRDKFFNIKLESSKMWKVITAYFRLIGLKGEEVLLKSVLPAAFTCAITLLVVWLARFG